MKFEDLGLSKSQVKQALVKCGLSKKKAQKVAKEIADNNDFSSLDTHQQEKFRLIAERICYDKELKKHYSVKLTGKLQIDIYNELVNIEKEVQSIQDPEDSHQVMVDGYVKLFKKGVNLSDKKYAPAVNEYDKEGRKYGSCGAALRQKMLLSSTHKPYNSFHNKSVSKKLRDFSWMSPLAFKKLQELEELTYDEIAFHFEDIASIPEEFKKIRFWLCEENDDEDLDSAPIVREINLYNYIAEDVERMPILSKLFEQYGELLDESFKSEAYLENEKSLYTKINEIFNGQGPDNLFEVLGSTLDKYLENEDIDIDTLLSDKDIEAKAFAEEVAYHREFSQILSQEIEDIKKEALEKCKRHFVYEGFPPHVIDKRKKQQQELIDSHGNIDKVFSSKANILKKQKEYMNKGKFTGKKTHDSFIKIVNERKLDLENKWHAVINSKRYSRDLINNPSLINELDQAYYKSIKTLNGLTDALKDAETSLNKALERVRVDCSVHLKNYFEEQVKEAISLVSNSPEFKSIKDKKVVSINDLIDKVYDRLGIKNYEHKALTEKVPELGISKLLFCKTIFSETFLGSSSNVFSQKLLEKMRKLDERFVIKDPTVDPNAKYFTRGRLNEYRGHFALDILKEINAFSEFHTNKLLDDAGFDAMVEIKVNGVSYTVPLQFKSSDSAININNQKVRMVGNRGINNPINVENDLSTILKDIIRTINVVKSQISLLGYKPSEDELLEQVGVITSDRFEELSKDGSEMVAKNFYFENFRSDEYKTNFKTS